MSAGAPVKGTPLNHTTAALRHPERVKLFETVFAISLGSFSQSVGLPR